MTKEMQDENDLEYILRSSMFNGTMHQNLAYLFGATHLRFKQVSINCSPRTRSFQIKKHTFSLCYTLLNTCNLPVLILVRIIIAERFFFF